MSATMPAPPDGSIPAIVSTTGLSLLIARTEPTDSRKTTRSYRKTFFSIIECDAANRQHRKICEIARHLSQFVQTLRWTIRTLRIRFKHRTKDDEISATISRCPRFRNRMRRYANQKFRPTHFTHHSRRQRNRRQMHTVRTSSARNVETIINQHARRAATRNLYRARNEFVEHTRRQVLFADLKEWDLAKYSEIDEMQDKSVVERFRVGLAGRRAVGYRVQNRAWQVERHHVWAAASRSDSATP